MGIVPTAVSGFFVAPLVTHVAGVGARASMGARLIY
jgi:hypothetical protein